jgi:hypothetical protein
MSTDTITVPPETVPAVPAQITATAATLRICAGCGALPGYCLDSLTGLSHRPCCGACDHHPELPRRAADLPHPPEQCAAWADERHVPRSVACAGHWKPDAVLEYEATVVARYWAEVRARAGQRRPYSEAELVPAHVLAAEDHGPSGWYRD